MGNFRPWIDIPTTGVNGNILTNEEFKQLSSRVNGFAPNTVISSKEVNSALRQANLVVTALMETVGPNFQSGSLESSVNAIKFAFTTFFNPMITSVVYNNETHQLTITNRAGNAQSYTIGPFEVGTVDRAENDALGRRIDITYALKGWSEEYDISYGNNNVLLANDWSDYSEGSEDGNENQIILYAHEVTEDDNLIIAVDKTATKAQCEAFNAALLQPVTVDGPQIIVKALGTIPSVDIPVKVVKI